MSTSMPLLRIEEAGGRHQAGAEATARTDHPASIRVMRQLSTYIR